MSKGQEAGLQQVGCRSDSEDASPAPGACSQSPVNGSGCMLDS